MRETVINKSTSASMSRIAIIVVSYGHDKVLSQLLVKLGNQKKNYDRLVVVDNHPNKKGALVARETGVVDVILESDNHGFSAGCNIGARSVKDEVDTLLFINPDTSPETNLLDVIRQNQKINAITMPLLVLPNKKVNSAGNIVHISGLSWCGGFRDKRSFYQLESDIYVASGACFGVRVDWWNKLGGLEEIYFMYYEDTDFSTRVILLGGSIKLLPDTQVVHDYEYIKGDYKWFYLERNRLLYIVRCWPRDVIIVLLPMLFAVEIALWVVAAVQGRLFLKLKSTISMFKVIPAVIRSRYLIQKTSVINAYDFYQTLVSPINNPALGSISNNKVIDYVFESYYKLAGFILKKLTR